MSFTTILRKVNYDITGGDKAQLFPPINVKGQPSFSLQIYTSGVVLGAPLNADIYVKISNADTETAPPDSEFTEIGSQPAYLGGGVFPLAVGIDTAGIKTYYVAVGVAQGFGNCNWVTLSFKRNNMAEGTIDKVLLCGALGNQ